MLRACYTEPMPSRFHIPFIREAPVTAACLLVCVALFVLTGGLQFTPEQRLGLLDRWGAVIERPDVQRVDPDKVVVDYELRGPIALWQGELWRLPVCAFHHVDLWHLLVNAASAVYLGLMVERYFGSVNLLKFLPAATAIPMIPEFLLGNYVMGFSGVIAAMFGILCVLRLKDEELAEIFPEEAVYLGGVLLGAGVLFTMLDVAPVANLAHMTGFFLGALAGCVVTGLPWGEDAAWQTRLVTYLLAIASLWFISHPSWDGAYHWYLAKRANSPASRIAELQEAVKHDPQLIGAYRVLADAQMKQGFEIDAWKTIVTGLANNPADSSLLRLSQRLWHELSVSPGRIAARQAVREIFEENADVWLAQLETNPPDDIALELLRRLTVAEIDPEKAFPLNRAIDLRLPELIEQLRKSFDQPRMPPEGDAVEGRRM